MHDSGDLRRNRSRAGGSRSSRRGRAGAGRTTTRLVASLAAVALAGFATISAASPAGAAPSAAAAAAQQCNTNTAVTPSLTTDVATVDAAATSTINITGTNYLVPPHVCGTQVFGGIYVFFGWVQPGGQWGPSHRTETSPQGLFGTSYSYPGEGGGAKTRDDGTGVVRLVSFTEGGESGDATDFHMDTNGNWSTNIVVRGSSYSFTNVMDGSSSTVDCLKVQCGVFTIGAHGKASGTNELFTPINFTVAGTPVVPQASGGAGGGSSATTGGATGGGDGSTGTDSGSTGQGATGTDGATTTTAASGEVGTVGSAGAGSSDDGDEQADGARTVDAESTAAVQDFDNQGGGGSGGLVIAVVVVLVLALAAGGVVLLRRRSAATVGTGR